MRLWLCAAAVNGFLAVTAGTLAAHSLEGRVAPQALDWVMTAARYQMVHGLALIGVAWLAERAAAGASWQGRMAALSGWCFLAGTILFSGVLYLMAAGAPRALGAIVPFGGLAFLAGWLALLAYGLGPGRRP